MSTEGHVHRWLDQLGYGQAQGLFGPDATLGSRPYAAEIGDMLSAETGIGATHVFCVDDVPVTCFFDLTKTSPEDLLTTVRERIWNQGLASVVIGLSADSLLAYPVLCRGEQPEGFDLALARPNGPWSPHDFVTGAVQRRRPNWFESSHRVDQRLLESLTALIVNIEPGMGRRPAEALVAQLIFVRYLEDRGIVGDHYRARHDLRLLHDLVKERAGSELDGLIAELGKTFAGDFLRNTGFSPPSWADVSQDAFDVINRFLTGENLSTGELHLWGYDFSIVPVELISSIYESFLAKRKKSQGAYYTPRNLATLAVEMAFEGGPAPHQRRVFDGACGSGILLTTAFQKMLASAEGEAGRRLTFTERVDLMRSHIFGGDIDSTACWITSFSLCLCLLARLTPADIVKLQEDEGTQLPDLIGDDHANIRSGKDHGDFFRIAGTGDVDSWDLIISNPPWREGSGKSPEAFEVATKQEFGEAPLPDRQIAAAYAYFAATRLAQGGTLSLILPLNLMIGIDSAPFRQKLLELLHIERIVNFGDVRFLLFPMAKLSCAIVVGRPRAQVEGPLFGPDERIEYWSPKADLAIALGSLAVAPQDRALVTPGAIYRDPAILIHRYWGRPRDLAILGRLGRFGTIESVAAGRTWTSNKGFHATDNNNPTYRLDEPSVRVLWDKPFMATKALPKNHPVVTSEPALPLTRDKFETVATPGGDRGRLYDGNRVIWRNGLAPDHRIRAVFSGVPFAFQHTTCAIGGVEGDADILKFLAVYLRSSLTAYFMMLNSFSAIGDRNAVSKYEVMTLPFADPENHPNPAAAKAAIRAAADIVNRIAELDEHLRDSHYALLLPELEDIVCDYFGLSEMERALVRETVRDVAPAMQPHSYARIASALTDRPDRETASRYKDALGQSLARFRAAREGVGEFRVTVGVEQQGGVFGSVEVCVGQACKPQRQATRLIDQLITDIMAAPQTDGRIHQFADAILSVGDCLYLIKPLQRRFWGIRAALEDFDRIVSVIEGAEPVQIDNVVG